jgi:hypothetical protein
MPVQIPLANAPSEFAIVDDEDAVRVKLHTWKRMKPPRSKSSYAYTKVRAGNFSELLFLHRFVLGLRKGDRRLIDHKNRLPLDCRKENLRIVTSSGNRANVAVQSHSKTGLKGVCWARREQKWRATISWEGTTHHLGYYTEKSQAGLAYNIAAERLHGECGVLNVLPETIPENVANAIRVRVEKHLSKSFRFRQGKRR